MQPDLTIAIISADNLSLLLGCLRSVFASTHYTVLEVYLVDNASNDATSAAVQAEFPLVKILHNDSRLGFSTNNNLVLRQGTGRYLMLLNDDTLVQDGALDILVSFMDGHPEAGAAGSFLLNPDRSFQSTFAFFPHPLVEALWPSANWSHLVLREQQAPFEVDSVCGAAMIVRRAVVESVGVLDTAFDPIYSEEVDWCYRIKQAGWKIYAVPQSRIIHFGSQTMNKAVPRKYELLWSHKLLFFRKHKGTVSAAIYRVLLGFSTGVKLLYWTIRKSISRNEEDILLKRELHRYLFKRVPRL